MVVLLPEIYEGILAAIPVSRVKDDNIALLYSCTLVPDIRWAATLSNIWRPHYRACWRRADDLHERDRLESCEGNYYYMFKLRRQLDRRALRALDDIIHRPALRREASQRIVDLGRDVWDILQIQSTTPAPWEAEYDQDTPEYQPTDWLSRRYWSKEILDMMTRRSVVSAWITAIQGEEMSLESGLCVLSGFWGIDEDEVCC